MTDVWSLRVQAAQYAKRSLVDKLNLTGQFLASVLKIKSGMPDHDLSCALRRGEVVSARARARVVWALGEVTQNGTP